MFGKSFVRMMMVFWVTGISQLVTRVTSNMDRSCSNANLDCVCNIHGVIRKLKLYIDLYGGDILENKIKAYKCEQLDRLPKSLVIDATSGAGIFDVDAHQQENFWEDTPSTYDFDFLHRRRYKRRRKRYINLGVPTNEAFSEAIAHVDLQALHQYIILGSSVTFHCNRLEEAEYENPGSDKTVDWTHFNGEPITAHAIVDRATGTLTIPTVQLSDIGIYNCTKRFSGDESQEYSTVTSHQLSIISEPIFWIKFSINYGTDKCNFAETPLIRNHIPKWIKSYVCPVCQVHNASISCFKVRSRSSYKLKAVVSAIGLSLQTEKTNLGSIDTCHVSCLEIMHSRILEIVRDSMIRVFQLPIEVHGSENRKLIHNVLEETLEIDLLLGCLSGFHLKHKLCFPCMQGQFSQEGNTECLLCPAGFYQSQLAATSCIPCSTGLTTLTTGSTSISQCHAQGLIQTAATITDLYIQYKVIGGVIGGLLLLFFIVIVLICLCCRDSRIGRVVSKYCCCCCIKTRQKYEKLEEDSDKEDLTRSKTQRKKKERTKSRVQKSETLRNKNIPTPPPLPGKEANLKSSRRNSKQPGRISQSRDNDSPLFEIVHKQVNDVKQRNSLQSSFPNPSPIDEGFRSDEKDSDNDLGRSMTDVKLKSQAPLESTVTRTMHRKFLSEPAVHTFENVIDELKYRFSFHKPIGASEEEGSIDKRKWNLNMKQDLKSQKSTSSSEFEDAQFSNQDAGNTSTLKHQHNRLNVESLNQSSEDEISDEESETSDISKDDKFEIDRSGSNESFKSTPLRTLIALHNARSNSDTPLSEQHHIKRTSSSSIDVDEEETDQSESPNPSKDFQPVFYIPKPPPMPPPPLVFS